MFCPSKGGGGGGGWGDFHIKRTPKRFQDLVLWAWLEMFFFLPLIGDPNAYPPYVMLCYVMPLIWNQHVCMFFFSSEINISEIWCVNISVVTYSCEINI